MIILFVYFSPTVSVGVVESVCEWVVEGCERLSQLWWRACSEGGGEEDHHRALRSLLLGAAARATHALTPLTAPNAVPPPPPTSMSSAAPAQQTGDSKDPRMVAMMQQYTDILVNMVQQKMASHQPPPGPTWSNSCHNIQSCNFNLIQSYGLTWKMYRLSSVPSFEIDLSDGWLKPLFKSVRLCMIAFM